MVDVSVVDFTLIEEAGLGLKCVMKYNTIPYICVIGIKFGRSGIKVRDSNFGFSWKSLKKGKSGVGDAAVGMQSYMNW